MLRRTRSCILFGSADVLVEREEFSDRDLRDFRPGNRISMRGAPSKGYAFLMSPLLSRGVLSCRLWLMEFGIGSVPIYDQGNNFLAGSAQDHDGTHEPFHERHDRFLVDLTKRVQHRPIRDPPAFELLHA